MDRTGIKCQDALTLFQSCQHLDNIRIVGLHAYDGHIHAVNLSVRQQEADEVVEQVFEVKAEIEKIAGTQMKIVMGGTPTFAMYGMEFPTTYALR